MRLTLSLFVLCLSMQCAIYAAPKGLYWVPQFSYGALYTKEGEQISAAESIGIYRAHYHVGEKIGLLVAGSSFLEYKKGMSVYEGGYVQVIGNYSPLFLKKHLFSRTLQGYLQTGGWYARIQAVFDQGGQAQICEELFKGAGLVVGVGAQYAIFSRAVIEFSWQKLIDVPILNNKNRIPIQGKQQLNIGLMIRIF